MYNKLLSICIPVYNGSKYLSFNLNIILKQIIDNKYEDIIEILISDNASIDNTQEIIQTYLNQYPNIIRYNRNSTNLLYDNNVLKLCKLARGKYIHFLGNDDFYTDNGIERILNEIQLNDYSVLICSNNWFYENDKITRNRDSCDHLYNTNKIIDNLDEFVTFATYRLWCLSDIIVKTAYIQNINENFSNIKDWIHVTIALYSALQKNSYFYFSDLNPILTIRLQNQNWLNDRSNEIYLNNLKTFCNATEYGYKKKHIEYFKDIFIKHVFKRKIRTNSITQKIYYCKEYFKILKNKPKFYTKILPNIFRNKSRK